MKIRVLSLYLCLILSTTSVGGAYFQAGYWQIVPILLGILTILGMMRKLAVHWADSSFMLLYIVLAATGVVAGFSTAFMIVACTFTLASWDLLRFEGSMAGGSTSPLAASLENHHLRSLAVAICTGLLFAIISLYIRLQLPFIVVASLVLIALGSLTFSVQYTRKAKGYSISSKM